MLNRISISSLALILTATILCACVARTETPDKKPAYESSGDWGTKDQQSAHLQKELDTLLQPWVSDSAPGLAVAVSWQGKTIFNQAAGLADLELHQPITAESVFQVASVSKQFTAFAVLKLATEQKLDLDADIRTYIPDLPKTEKIITVRHLLDHTGGLRERNTLAAMAGWMPDDIHTQAQLHDLIIHQNGVNFAAGMQIEYSNTGYGLLAEIIETVSGQSYQSYLAENIFEPLEMSHSRVRQDRNDLIPNRARSYYPVSDGFKNVIANSENVGSTGLYTSVTDLLKWARNFETLKVGSPEVLSLMEERFQAQNGDESIWAKGQELRLFRNIQTWSHGGRDAGYRSFLLRVPDKKLAVAIISNRTDFDTADMAFTIADIFLASEPDYVPSANIEWTPAASAELASYSGNYEIYPGVIFTIASEANGLTIAPLGASRVGLKPIEQVGPGEFLLNTYPEQTLVFEQAGDGLLPTMSIKHGLHGTIPTKRVKLTEFNIEQVNMREYVGRCESTELSTFYTIELSDGALFAKHQRLPAFSIIPYQKDIFYGSGALQKLEFLRDGKDNITGFMASGPLAEDILFSCEDRS